MTIVQSILNSRTETIQEEQSVKIFAELSSESQQAIVLLAETIVDNYHKRSLSGNSKRQSFGVISAYQLIYQLVRSGFL
jgi:hypothetical protein